MLARIFFLHSLPSLYHPAIHTFYPLLPPSPSRFSSYFVISLL
jgi:hypothetical protein